MKSYIRHLVMGVTIGRMKKEMALSSSECRCPFQRCLYVFGAKSHVDGDSDSLDDFMMYLDRVVCFCNASVCCQPS